MLYQANRGNLHTCSVDMTVTCFDSLRYSIFLLTRILPGAKSNGRDLCTGVQFALGCHLATIALKVTNKMSNSCLYNQLESKKVDRDHPSQVFKSILHVKMTQADLILRQSIGLDDVEMRSGGFQTGMNWTSSEMVLSMGVLLL